MEFDDRIEGLIIGCLIGFIFGYITRALREIRDEIREVRAKVDEVDFIVTEEHPEARLRHLNEIKGRKNEEGVTRHPILMNVVLALVVLMTAYAAFQSQQSSNDIQEAQARDDKIIECVLTHLEQTTTALNERTELNTQAAQANVDLQRAQAQFLHIVMSPGSSEAAEDEALRDYVTTLTDFVAANARLDQRSENYPYPTREQLSNCLKR